MGRASTVTLTKRSLTTASASLLADAGISTAHKLPPQLQPPLPMARGGKAPPQLRVKKGGGVYGGPPNLMPA